MSHFNNAALSTSKLKQKNPYAMKREAERQKLEAKLTSGDLCYIKQARGVYCGFDDCILTNLPAAAFTGTHVRNERHMHSYQSVNGIGTLNALDEIFKYHKTGLNLVKTTKATPARVKSVESKVAGIVQAHCKKLGVKVVTATATTITGTYRGKDLEITAASAWSWNNAFIKVDGVLFHDPDHHMSFKDAKLIDVGPTLVQKPEFNASLLKLSGFDPVKYRKNILSAKTPKRYNDADLLETMKELFKYFEFTTEAGELWLVPVGNETFGSAKEHIWSYNVTTATLHTNNGWICLDKRNNPDFTSALWDLCHYVRFGKDTRTVFNTKTAKTKAMIKFNEYSDIMSTVTKFLGYSV